MIPKPEPLTTEGQSEDPNKNNTRAKVPMAKTKRNLRVG